MRKKMGAVLWSLAGMVTIAPFAVGQGQEPGYIEEFALAPDRAKALAQLIPGTEDYYYYHSLDALNQRQWEKLGTYTKPWLERFGKSQRLIEIETRAALLGYDRDPKKTFEYLRQRIGVQYRHEKEFTGIAPNLPTALDAKLISRETLLAESMRRWANLDNFEDSALDWLQEVPLNWEKRRNLLQRLAQPDGKNLVKLIIEDDEPSRPQSFGAYRVERLLTIAQLEELVTKKPAWLNESTLVQAWLPKLQPGADSDWRQNPAEITAYLDRLWAFATRLQAMHNSLKVHVLYHRLVHDRSQGIFDKARFLTYLALPRRQHYMAKALNESQASQRYGADLGADYHSQTLFPIVGSDEELVRSYLKHFLVEAETTKEFDAFIDGDYLRHLFAEVKVENGLGDPEKWATLLPPEMFKSLKERIDIEFAPTNKTHFGVNESVVLDVHVKNVPSLMVKVFEVNTGNYYKGNLREIDTDINLDGLIANEEKTHTYNESPLRRVPRRFEFKIDKPGVYIVDFIGSGKSSRALIRKGKLRPLTSITAGGLAVTVLDEKNQMVKDASIWLSGKDYAPDEKGVVLLPFSTEPGRRQIILTQGGLSCLDSIQHPGEVFQFKAGLHIDREALLSQRLAKVLVRPGLTLAGVPVSLSLIEEVRLRIASTDANGIVTTTEIPDFKLFEDRETVHEFRVPEGISQITVKVEGKIKNLSRGRTETVQATHAIELNGILKTEKVEDLHLVRSAEESFIEVLGRSGEARPDRPIQIALKHRDFREPVQVTLKSDAKGRVHLGALAGIINVVAIGSEQTSHSWPMITNQATRREMIHARSGEPIVMAYSGKLAVADRSEFSLFEIVGGLPKADQFGALRLAGGMIEIRDLAPGDYELWMKPGAHPIRIRVVKGEVVASHIVGEARDLRVLPLKPLQIGELKREGGDLVLKLKNASNVSRIHLFGVRYQPGLNAFDQFNLVRAPELDGVIPGRAPSVYITGRNIGDEYRYVLDRKGQKKYPGVMIDRPTLLINPWAVRETTTSEQVATGGDVFGAKGGVVPAKPDFNMSERDYDVAFRDNSSAFADLDFLAESSAIVTNLVPDKEGIVRISLKELGNHVLIQAVACDPLQTVTKTLRLNAPDLKIVDQRLLKGLNPAGKFLREKKVSVLAKGEPFTVEDIRSSKFEIYDSLAKIHNLFFTLNKDAALAEFSFLAGWSKLKPEEKRTLLSKHGCHELHFFIHQKDRAFFDEVVRPFLANKKDKTFIDFWLLDADLNRFLSTWEYSRLNTMERVLLAKRIKEEPRMTARHLEERLRLLPQDIERQIVLFDTAVSNGALGVDDALGALRLNLQRSDLQEREKTTFSRMERPEEMKMEMKKAAVRNPGGFGGGGGQGGPQSGSGANRTGGGAFGFVGGALPPGTSSVFPNRPVAGENKSIDSLRRGGRLEDRAGSKRNSEAKTEERLSDAESSAQMVQDHRKFQPTELYARNRNEALGIQLYRPIETTKEYAENNYRNLPIANQNADLVGPGAFWLDYVKHDGKTPFLSKNLASASRNFTESIFALAVTDLPFEAAKHELKFDASKLTVNPGGAAIAFHEEVRTAEVAAGQAGILVSQNFYKLGERFKDENGEKLDKFVVGEYIAQTAYGCQIVITNPNSSRRKLTLLLQVPVGSIPLNPSQMTRSIPLDLEPYRTQTIDYSFYFPVAGNYAQLPVQVSEKGKSVAAAVATAFAVVDKPTKTDTGSWDFVSQNGTDKEVLEFLARENLQALNLDRIAFRMKDSAFFQQVTALLATRHVYQNTLWSYALLHGEPGTAQEFLKHNDTIVNDCAGPIQTPILTIDPVARFQYEHLEYKPLVNARAHALGPKRQIVNDRLAQQYRSFLKLLSYQRELGDVENLALVIYLLEQDRIEEANAAFNKVDPGKIPSKLPYDYAKAWLMLATEQPAKAREIALVHAKHPVDRWRESFVRIIDQVNEAEGKENAKAADPENRSDTQDKLAAQEPSFEFVIEGSKLMLTWQNLKEVTVNHYLMDVELLFSRNPFVQQSGGEFAFIKPNQTKVIKLADSKGKMEIALPADLVKRNLLVEIAAAGKTRTVAYYSSAMDLKMFEGQGQLKVTARDAATPLSKVYVKVYARLADGSVKFHKDGYTDLRGRFDYATVSTPEKQPIQRFAILVLSEHHGATIKETAPPQR